MAKEFLHVANIYIRLEEFDSGSVAEPLRMSILDLRLREDLFELVGKFPGDCFRAAFASPEEVPWIRVRQGKQLGSNLGRDRIVHQGFRFQSAPHDRVFILAKFILAELQFVTRRP